MRSIPRSGSGPSRRGDIVSTSLAFTVAAVVASVALTLLLGSRKHLVPRHYVQLMIDGVRGGSIYALIALGFVVIHSVTGIINFAQGEFVMLGAMLALTIYHTDLPLPPVFKLMLSITLAIVGATLVGLILERAAIYPARNSPVASLIIITIGATVAIRALALLVWGTRPYYMPAFTTLELEDIALRFGGGQGSIIVKAQSLWIWGTVAIVLAGLFVFFERTIVGKALRACAVNRVAAELMGISSSRMSMLAFALAAALGGIGGIVLAPATRPTYDMGLILGLKGFVAAIMGGLVSFPGAVAGGLILGVAENVGAGVTKAGFKDIIAFVILIVILLVKPQGIIGDGGDTRH
jgi:branched-chain amino acid transport system permease protein